MPPNQDENEPPQTVRTPGAVYDEVPQFSVPHEIELLTEDRPPIVVRPYPDTAYVRPPETEPFTVVALNRMHASLLADAGLPPTWVVTAVDTAVDGGGETVVIRVEATETTRLPTFVRGHNPPIPFIPNSQGIPEEMIYRPETFIPHAILRSMRPTLTAEYERALSMMISTGLVPRGYRLAEEDLRDLTTGPPPNWRDEMPTNIADDLFDVDATEMNAAESVEAVESDPVLDMIDEFEDGMDVLAATEPVEAVAPSEAAIADPPAEQPAHPILPPNILSRVTQEGYDVGEVIVGEVEVRDHLDERVWPAFPASVLERRTPAYLVYTHSSPREGFITGRYGLSTRVFLFSPTWGDISSVTQHNNSVQLGG